MEVAGLSVGVIALVGLADSCVNCFQYVQLGKKFGEDRQRARLRLDVLQLRLSRWVEAISDSESPPSPIEVEQTKVLLEGIINTFEDAERVSSNRKLGFSRQTDAAGSRDHANQDLELEKLQTTMRQMALRDQKQSSLKERVSWAIHGRDRLDKLLEDLTALIDGLVELFPAGRKRQEQLADEQTEKLTRAGRRVIKLLEDAAAGRDPMLQSSIRESLENAHKHSYHKNTTTDEARARYGDEVNGNRIPIMTVGNSYAQNLTSGKAIAHFGNSYGGRSIFDL